MAEEKQAKKVYTLEEIKFNEANKVMAILACIPLIGLILFFVEKEDKFVRFIGIQFTILAIVSIFVAIIPVIGWLLAGPVMWILIIVGMVKTSKGERFDLPFISGWALKQMGSL